MGPIRGSGGLTGGGDCGAHRWMMRRRNETSFFLILVFHWLIAAGDFAHIVAGSVGDGGDDLDGQLGVIWQRVRVFLRCLRATSSRKIILYARRLGSSAR